MRWTRVVVGVTLAWGTVAVMTGGVTVAAESVSIPTASPGTANDHVEDVHVEDAHVGDLLQHDGAAHIDGDVITVVDGAPGDAPGVGDLHGAVTTAGAGEGFALIEGIRAVRTHRVVRFDPALPWNVRAAAIEAVRQINAVVGINLTIGPDTTAGPQDGEIVVVAVTETTCGPRTAGCALNRLVAGVTDRVARSTIELKSAHFGSPYIAGTVFHELGHALGLAHFDGDFAGARQVMFPGAKAGVEHYQAGDRNGFAALARLTTNPNVAGSIDRTAFMLGKLHVAGWALDRDMPTSPLAVGVYVDGVPRALVGAKEPRHDVARAFPGAGALHGYSVQIPMGAGTYTVCMRALGHRNQLVQTGCRTVTVSHNPVGNVEAIAAFGPRPAVLTGWALDPDVVGPTVAHAYVDGRFVGQTTTTASRPDVVGHYPGAESARGFSIPLGPQRPGPHVACAYGINTGPGNVNSLLGCKTFVTPGGNPFGNVDSLARGADGSTWIAGWAIDPDTAEPINVHVYVNGRFTTASSAAVHRSDVGRAHPGYGAEHGFNVRVSGVRVGARVCTYAINTGAGTTNPLLGCRIAR